MVLEAPADDSDALTLFNFMHRLGWRVYRAYAPLCHPAPDPWPVSSLGPMQDEGYLAYREQDRRTVRAGTALALAQATARSL